MPKLILVKHSLPRVERDSPAARWQLSDEGRARCAALAERLRAHAPDVIVSSIEPKAAETARLVAAHLGLPCETAPGLHEHERASAGWLERDAFEAAVRTMLARPADVAFGDESADTAHARFAAAVDALLQKHAGKTLAFVAHGTVIALYVSRRAPRDAFALWRSLDTPSYVVLDRASGEIVEEWHCADAGT